MLELVTVQIDKYVRNINEKRKERHYSKKWLIKPFGQSDVVNSSVRSMCIRFVTIRRITKKECVCLRSCKKVGDICGLILFKLLMRVHLSLIYEGHWSRK